jgi:hypothetical protein
MPRSLLALLVTFAIFAVVVAQRPGEAPPAPLPIAEAKPQYWKGNLHTHSLWSDGDDFPEMIADWYKRHGYQFLALTDHNIIADAEKWVDAETTPVRKKAVEKYQNRFGKNWLEWRTEKDKKQVRLKPLREFRSLLEEPGKFLFVPAEEITSKFAKFPVHMNGINLRDAIKPIEGANVTETIRANLKQTEEQSAKTTWPNITFLNHPNFQWGVKAEEMIAAEELRYFEVFNGHSGVRNYGDETHAGCERIWDILLAVRLAKLGLPVVYGVATDDSHAYHEFAIGKTNPGRGWCMVRTQHLTAESIVRAMKAGDFYFSTGVSFDSIAKADGKLSLAIRTEPSVTYTTEFIATMKGAPLDSELIKDKDGKELDVTRKYSDDIGKVAATSTDANPSYAFTGNELYVRAKVTSSKPHPNPYQKGDTEVAWTQPFVR